MSGRAPPRAALRASRLVLPVLLSFVLAILMAPSASAHIDLVSPAENAITNALNVSFEYWPSMPGIGQCTLDVSGQQFQDITIDNGTFNRFTVVNIQTGSHNWSITCTNATDTEYSVVRTLHIDIDDPVVAIDAPANGTTVDVAQLRFTATDETSASLTCSVYADSVFQTSVVATSGVQKTVPLSLDDGPHDLSVVCLDQATNVGTAQRSFILDKPEPELYLNLQTDKSAYGLGQPVLLTIDTLPDADVDVEVCPDAQGFVQCYTPIVSGSFPQTLILPSTNATGDFLVDGVAIRGNQSVYNTTGYSVENRMSVSIGADRTPDYGETVTLTANAHGALDPVSYEWTLHNGTIVDGGSVSLTYDAPGVFTERVVATDSGGNTAQANYTVRIDPVRELTVLVKDAVTDAVLTDATVQVENPAFSDTETTDANGEAFFTLKQAEYELFVSKEGYGYDYEKISVEEDGTITVLLAQNDNTKPVVTVLSPDDGAVLRPPVSVRFKVQDEGSVSCRIGYAKEGTQWMEQSGSQNVTPGQEAGFDFTTLEEANYSYAVECTDRKGNTGESERRSFLIDQKATDGAAPAPPPSVWDSADPLDYIDQAYGAYDSFNEAQRKLANLLGFEQLIKDKKRAIERAFRDKDSLTYRRDLSADEIAQQSADYDARISEAEAAIPLDLAVLETKTQVSYPKEEELRGLAEAIIAEKGYAATPDQLTAYLAGVQNAFTEQTTVYRALILHPGNVEQKLSVVTHTLTYDVKDGVKDSGTDKSADGQASALEAAGYSLYEAVPSALAGAAGDLVVLSDYKTLHERPLSLEFSPVASVAYYATKDVPIGELLGAKTILLKKPRLEDMKALTGNALLSGVAIDWKLSLFLTLLLAAAIFLVRRLDALRHLKYLFYAESGKRALHALRTLTNDGMAQLESGNLEQAMMRYKEAKLEYERLGTFAQNEGYADLLRLKETLDSSYFSLLTHRIQDALEAGRLHDAVDDFARLEATYESLAPDEQESLYGIVTEMARRLGLTKGEEGVAGYAPAGTGAGGGSP